MQLKENTKSTRGLNKTALGYIARFDEVLREDIQNFSDYNGLSEAISYSLTNGGKRFRPLIVYFLAEALGLELNVDNAALSVEFFHTASLIADDLPCMDNDRERRGKPSLHIAFDETTALLASYALISAAFEKIYQASLVLSTKRSDHEKICAIALKEAGCFSGIHGATGGQYLDLMLKNPSQSELQRVIEKKTITLFNVAFIFGFLFGGGDLSKLECVKQCAYDFGMAFQVADDLADLTQDQERGSEANIALLLGEEKSFKIVDESLDRFIKQMKDLNLFSGHFRKLVDKVDKLSKS